ncbi:MAG: DUF6048 family protein [Prevotellaceae bacterium]|jgi:hypothetical protein|nr:DUF6048 family protein [Prevotellaceae bacterium]
MEQKICNSFISLFVSLTLLAPLRAQAQQEENGKPLQAEKADAAPYFTLYNGTTIGVDLWGIGGKVLGSDFLSSEVAIDVNLKNRFFPVLEAGYGTTNATADNGTHYQSSAPYFRIGLNYNILYKKNFKNYFFIGARYAFSPFSYHITSVSADDTSVSADGTSLSADSNPNLPDNVWGDATPPFDHRMKGSMHWLEIYGGIRARIWKSLYMGWGIRMKYRLSSSGGTNGDPWYVPGFGRFASNTMGVSYTITYLLPL